jgi:hypothetical protein
MNPTTLNRPKRRHAHGSHSTVTFVIDMDDLDEASTETILP